MKVLGPRVKRRFHESFVAARHTVESTVPSSDCGTSKGAKICPFSNRPPTTRVIVRHWIRCSSESAPPRAGAHRAAAAGGDRLVRDVRHAAVEHARAVDARAARLAARTARAGGRHGASGSRSRSRSASSGSISSRARRTSTRRAQAALIADTVSARLDKLPPSERGEALRSRRAARARSCSS